MKKREDHANTVPYLLIFGSLVSFVLDLDSIVECPGENNKKKKKMNVWFPLMEIEIGLI